MIDTHKRSIVKAISWRITGTIDTFFISWLITGEALLATGIAGTEIMTKVALFYFHERAWSRVTWGRKSDEPAAAEAAPNKPAAAGA